MSSSNNNTVDHQQIKSAIKFIQKTNPSKWHIHETAFAKNIASFETTSKYSQRDLLTQLVTSITTGYIGKKDDNDLLDFKIDSQNLNSFKLENKLSLHMTRYGSKEKFATATKLPGSGTKKFTEIQPRWFHIGPIEQAVNIKVQTKFVK